MASSPLSSFVQRSSSILQATHGATVSVVCRAARRAGNSAALVASLGLVTFAGGCVGSAPPHVNVAPERAAGPLADLRASVRVISDAPHGKLGQQYAAALRWAGIEVVPSAVDADIVTELRVTTRNDGARATTDVSLVVRAKHEQLNGAQVSFPRAEQAPKTDLSVLTAAVTESNAVRAHAERVAVVKAEQNRQADETAWQEAQAEKCAQSSDFDDCRDVIRYLNGFPQGQYRAEAETALAQGERVRLRVSRDAAIARVKADIQAWNAANVEECRTPTAPTACDGVNAYLAAFPEGRFTEQANTLLSQAKPKLAELSEKAQRLDARRVNVTAQR